MGDIADAMLDGTLCESCGVFIDSEPGGFPRKCRDCGGSGNKEILMDREREKVPCPTCGKYVKRAGLNQHMKDVHRGLAGRTE